MGFRVDPSQVLRGLGEAKLKTMFAVEKYGQAAAAKLEATAKQDAPWIDRTGNARQTMAGVCDWAGDALRIGLAGNMDYSPYLEYCDGGKNAVLYPTINKMQTEILEGMRGIVK